MDAKTARTTDPESSHLAGEDVTKSGVRHNQQLIATRCVRETPGRTSAELAVIHDKDRYMLGRRLGECSGLKKGAMRQCVVSKRQAVTWWPV